MDIEIKGHSGCEIDVVKEGKKLFVYKSSYDPKYFERLIKQAEKQREASIPEYQFIRVPKILDIQKSSEKVSIKMDYVYSKNFVEFFEHAGFEQIQFLIDALKMYIEKEIEKSPIVRINSEIIKNKFIDVYNKTLSNLLLGKDADVIEILNKSRLIFESVNDMEMPVGECHGDLTFSNILFNGNNYFLIDFLDSFIESPLLDIVKLRQDTAWLWSGLMYTKQFDSIRLKIAFEKIDNEIDSFFSEKYDWYNRYYDLLQLMNFLRILQYGKDKNVIDYLKTTINEQLQKF